ncbi:hypothetical protein [Streptomyces purpurascens]|uniref:Uncharacterized protein n=1 Tax=Streptomyces purpurascens TaxID=1924 RepID=A0ABZ1MY64_STREF
MLDTPWSSYRRTSGPVTWSAAEVPNSGPALPCSHHVHEALARADMGVQYYCGYYDGIVGPVTWVRMRWGG